MTFGQNWILFTDKPPISSIPGRNVVESNFNVIVANKTNNNFEYSIMTALEATKKYYSESNVCYAWKFIDPCKI